MLHHELKVSHRRLRELLTQSAKVGYDFDIAHLPRRAVPFEKNTVLHQVVAAAVELAKKFGGDDSPAFINGILGKIGKKE